MRKTVITAIALATAMLASCGHKATSATDKGQTSDTLKNNTPETTYTMNADGCKLTWIQDMPGEMKQSRETFPTIPDSLFEAYGCQDGIPSSMSCFLLESSGQKVLFDAGLGGEKSLLIPTLKNMGTSPDDISAIFITHLHGDHIGNLAKDGQKVFPNAKLYISKAESEYWRSMQQGNDAQLAIMNLYKDSMVLFEPGDTLQAGIISIKAYGHTPGHTIYKKGKFLVAGDLMHGLKIQLRNPEYSAKWDWDHEMAAQTRKSIIEMAESECMIMAGMHFPANGFKKFCPQR